MRDDKLTGWEKTALVLSMAGQVLSVFLWYVGTSADLSVALPWLKVAFGIAGAIALDLVVVTTTMGQRAGRQSRWGAATIFAAALFSAAIALDIAGGPTLGAWNHISYPVVIVLFAQHLAAPKQKGLPQADQDACEHPSITVVPPAQLLDTLVDIIQWKDVDGLSFGAIGSRLGISRQAAQKRYEKAKAS